MSGMLQIKHLSYDWAVATGHVCDGNISNENQIDENLYDLRHKICRDEKNVLYCITAAANMQSKAFMN